MENNRLIELKNVSKEFDGELALNDVSLYVRDGEFLTLLGPSGCGKTTLLRIIAGFTVPTSGKVIMAGEDMSRVPPHKRKVNTVFQKYALFPHLNVFDNVAFGLKIKKTPKADIARRVEKMLELVNLKGYGKRYIDQLSGGQQQRVAIARALASGAQVILADEPTGNLDSRSGTEIMRLICDLAERDHTIVLITHNQEVADMAGRTVYVHDGRLYETREEVPSGL